MPWADEQAEQADIAQASAQVIGLEAAYATLGADTLELRQGPSISGGALGRTARQGCTRSATACLIHLRVNLCWGAWIAIGSGRMADAKLQIVELMRVATDADELQPGAHPQRSARAKARPARPRCPSRRVQRHRRRPPVALRERRHPRRRRRPLPHHVDRGADQAPGHLRAAAGVRALAPVSLDDEPGCCATRSCCSRRGATRTRPISCGSSRRSGSGNYFRVSHEHILFGVRGDAGRTRTARCAAGSRRRARSTPTSHCRSTTSSRRPAPAPTSTCSPASAGSAGTSGATRLTIRATAEWRLGDWGQQEVRNQLEKAGWFVLPAYCIEDGGAPMLTKLLRKHVLPDLQVFRNGSRPLERGQDQGRGGLVPEGWGAPPRGQPAELGGLSRGGEGDRATRRPGHLGVQADPCMLMATFADLDGGCKSTTGVRRRSRRAARSGRVGR